MTHYLDEFDHHEFLIRGRLAGERLDAYLARRFPKHSRTVITRLVREGLVQVNGQQVKASYRLREGDAVALELPRPWEFQPEAQEIPIDVLHEDDTMIVVNKPPGMVVHPSRGHWTGTLVNALLHHTGAELADSEDPTRPGVVHRLDEDTSGVVAVAKSSEARCALAQQFEHRTAHKEYVAIVAGEPELDGDEIDLPIGRSRKDRFRMAIRRDGDARDAVSAWRVLRRFRGFAQLLVEPRTGRTHQIRVHLAAIGHPCLADPLYGHEKEITLRQLDLEAAEQEGDRVLLARQALHALRLTLQHPDTGLPMTFEAPLPPDLETLLAALERYRGKT